MVMNTIKNKYSIASKIYLVYCLIRTKLISHTARLIRFPFTIRGRENIELGKRLTTGVGCRLEAFSNDHIKRIIFGTDVQLNDYVHISAMESVYIGNNVLMASHIYISDNSHGIYKGDNQSSPNIPPIKRLYKTAPVRIEDNVWIGEGVVIMPGVTIGKGCIIGSNSVVTKDIKEYSIAVGQPAKIIKQFDFLQNKWINTL